MKSILMKPNRLVAAAFAVCAIADAAAAATLTRAQLTIDATTPGAAAVEVELTVAEEGKGPRNSLDFFLVEGVSISKATSGGKTLAPASNKPVAKTNLRQWTVTLPSPMTSKSPSVIALGLEMKEPLAGAEVNEAGGFLFAGAGWFPSMAMNSDPVLPHSTVFRLPAGFRGIASGSQSGAAWTSSTNTRPFAAWGTYQVQQTTVDNVTFELWRTTATPPAPETLQLVASSWNALTTGFGNAVGSGPLRLVDSPSALLASGARTLFWNDARFVPGKNAEVSALVARDLAVGLAPCFWNEGIAFSGDDAGWLARAVPELMGDEAYIASLRSSFPDRVERELNEARRDLFLRSKSIDRPLRGLVPQAPGASDVLRGRGALTLRMIADAFPSNAHWVSFLEGTRLDSKVPLTGPRFLEALARKAPNQHGFLAPFLESTKLPDFHIVGATPNQGMQKDRLRVEIENRGLVESSVEVGIETSRFESIRSTRISIPPGQKRSIMFGDQARAGAVRLDPRSAGLQSDFSNELLQLQGTKSSAPLVPSYPVEGAYYDARQATGLNLDLAGITIRNFEGIVIPFRTFHGPSGAALLGKARVTLAPGPPHDASWKAAQTRESLSFDATDLWVRFPLESWDLLEKQLPHHVSSAEASHLGEKSRGLVEHSFPSFYFEEHRAQIPPSGGSLVTFTAAGGEMRGFVRQPLPDGKVFARLWDQLSGAVLWEETR